MQRFLIVLASILAFYSSPAESCSFRIKGGDLIRCGMTKIEVVDKIGNPDRRNWQSLGVNSGNGRGGVSAEAWSYIVRGDIGGEHYVTVLFSGSKVVEIESRQARR
ncbi:hypothetical protein J6I90_01000 [Pseudidiomarina sp. 1APP75-32.1]|uniref:DUF2845 domain-containing protein n=1 Tax=Pseudidiomarina terrestris TaxID=2820060 RepID=A0AAW7QTA4_9GAMM|nr:MULTISPECIES: hypothetical protein [unclassified Pseudidiomarina]MDN7123455.1 hypothetical protein [Pseudidiomarina sp. 1APP75-32.1]MDN7128820.1 hypothetical protein [Pseudidiomarina sp. 1APR75-15]